MDEGEACCWQLLASLIALSRRAKVGRLSPHTSQVAYEAGVYPGFRSMRPLGLFLLPPG